MVKPKPDVTVVIPARYGSSRFPGKPIAMLDRKPIIQHVAQQAAACRVVSEVVVATDDERIQRTVGGSGGQGSLDHRVFEAAPIGLPVWPIAAGRFS
jgi:3-deoxy-manno-octulosonate cytidylyltransferase (CMP-KDO synthetase)